ncbi:MAG: SDR family oxidoreductase [Pseudomonadota bacterium]|nr:SDR family oxidoreductase [Pseudomonadota bacterium]
MSHQKVLVVGASGYLGKFLIKELKRQGYWVRALSRHQQKIASVEDDVDEMFLGEATKPETLAGLCVDIDIVISALGITRQKDALTYRDVDYQANKNVLNAALKDKVTQFMYISVLNAHQLRHLAIVQAKEQFVDELKQSGLHPIIIRPNGFFSDMTAFLNSAQKGRIYLFGQGQYRVNPIHGADLAKACVERLGSNPPGEFDIGGPEILTQQEIALQAFEVLGKKPKIIYIPSWIASGIIKAARRLTSVKTYGPIEFFLTVFTRDMIAPTYGAHTLKEYFKTSYYC